MKVPSLIGEVLINKQLPSKGRIFGGIKNAATDFIKNPKQAIKEGLERDRIANQIIKGQGQTRLGLTKQALKVGGAGAYKGGGKDLLVNTGGLAGSIVGGGINPVAGTLAGDYLGATAARRVLNSGEAAAQAASIRNNPNFQALQKKQQQDILKKRFKGYDQSINKADKGEYTQDKIGFVVGNAAATTMQRMGSKVPLQGAAVALSTVPGIYKGMNVAKQSMKEGNGFLNSARKGGIATMDDIQNKFSIRKGLDREKRLTDSVNAELKKLPNLDPAQLFSYRYRNIVHL
jgi:hypothetical protein